MKHDNLQKLQQSGINVPRFIVLKSIDDYSPITAFLLDDNKKYAVRSSFASEDGTSLSYAGQFDTLLNVEKKDLKEAIQKVFNSTKNKNVRQYNKLNNVLTLNIGCVIVQEMIHADYSGVIFTANPLGILNETIIVVGKGLGCNVVEDKTNTTSYYYNQDDKLYYYEQQKNSPLLSEEHLKELIEVSEKIKQLFSYECDIEFAIQEDQIYILQVRPITTLKNNPIILDNSNIVESYPGVSLPLTQDFVKTIYHEIFYNCVLRITKDKNLTKNMDKYLKDMVDVANWRIYYRISNWYAVLKLLPFSNKIISMWQKMMGVTNLHVSTPEINVSIWTKLKLIHSMIFYLKKTPKLMDELNEKFEKEFKTYRESVEYATTINELLGLYEKIRVNIIKDWDITLINDMYTFIYTSLAGKKNKDLIANIKNLESMKPAIGIQNLVRTAEFYGMESEVYRYCASAYIDEFGDRCLGELKLETKTYRTNPELLHDYIKKQISQQIEIEKQNNTFENCKNKKVRNAKIGIRNREISRMNRSRLFGLSREIFRKIGYLLVISGKLENVDDVFYLNIRELNNQNLRDLIAKRKEEHKLYEKVPAYSRLVFDDKIINKTSFYSIGSVLDKKDKLYGIATSPGVVTGEVLVIDEPNDKLNTSGKILVTKSTDPGWIFLIHNAIGIIAEKGSLLSHTAIISRELHKPSIVNVKDCTTILKTGDRVELDANNGIIKIERGT